MAISRPSSSQHTTHAVARVVTREPATLCGRAWFDETFRQLDPRVAIAWHADDGDLLVADSVVCELQGPARSIVTGERTALNFLQTLSGTATAARSYAELVAGTSDAHPRHSQDAAGPAPRSEVRGALRRRRESPHRFVRRRADQREPHRRRRQRQRSGRDGATPVAASHDRSRGRNAGTVARSARDRRRPHHARRLLARRHASRGRNCAMATVASARSSKRRAASTLRR